MFSNKLNDILCLLVATILADKRVFSTEIDAFLKSSKALQAIYNIDENISKAKLLMWFENNNGAIRQKIRTPDFEPWLYGILERLSKIENKQPILDIMTDIAMVDEDYHVSEKALIVLTTGQWGLRA